MKKAHQISAALTVAAIGGVLMTGCGTTRNTAEQVPDHSAVTGTAGHTEHKADTTDTTKDRDGDPFDYDEQPHATSGPDIVDRAESAVDRAETAIDRIKDKMDKNAR